jgi:DNA polymerase-4
MSVRFETRASGPGVMRTFADDSPEVGRGDPLDSLDWPEYVASRAEQSAPGAEDVGDG